MDLFGILKTLFSQITRLFGLSMNFNGFSFTIGQMIIGLLIIGCSLQLLGYLLDK